MNRVKESEWEAALIAAALWANGNRWPTEDQLAYLRSLLNPERSQASLEMRTWRMQTAFDPQCGANGMSKLDDDMVELFELKPDVMMALARKLGELLTA